MRKRNQTEREAYQAEAERLRAAAQQQNQKDREYFCGPRRTWAGTAETMPNPKTLRQTILEFLGQCRPFKPQGPTKLQPKDRTE